MKALMLLALALVWGISCFGISLGLHALGGITAQYIFMPFAFLGGVGIGIIMIRRLS